MGDGVVGTGSDATGVSRRRFGRAVLLGGVAAGAASAVADAPGAGAAPVTDTWKLGGNAGVTEASNFLGTKDNHALVIRTNNVERMRVAPGGTVGIGQQPVATIALGVTSKPSSIAIDARSPFIGIIGRGTTAGVYGSTSGGSSSESGVYGESAGSAIGVSGYSSAFVGVHGQSAGGDGVRGVANNGNSQVAGVRGVATVSNANGVVGVADNGPSAYGVWGKAASGFAGFFSGRVQVTGTLTKGGGAFKIDHPLDPDGKYLSHSFVESPDMMNVYNGNVRTNGKGEATVTMPDWFEALNRDFRYQLTVIGQFAQAMVATEMAQGSFTIKTDKPSVKVSWQVTGIRQDAFANANRISVEEDKDRSERGTRLHPEAFGLGPEVSLDHDRLTQIEPVAEPVGIALATP